MDLTAPFRIAFAILLRLSLVGLLFVCEFSIPSQFDPAMVLLMEGLGKNNFRDQELTKYSVAQVLSVCIYRIAFHPYARYPGPFLAKFSNLHAAYHSWKGDLHVDIWRCHQRYGDRVRYAPGRLLFNTPKALREIYSNGEKNVTKSRAYEAMMHRVPNTITLRDRKEHARRRRILAFGFSDQAIKTYEDKMRVIVGRFCAALSPASEEKPNGGWSPSRNLADWSNYVFFDLSNDIIFGQDWNSIEKPENRSIVTSIQNSNLRSGILSNAAELKFWRLDKKLFPSTIIARGHFIKFILATVHGKVSQMKKGQMSTDIFSTLVRSKDEDTGTRLSQEELGAETANLISAGSDTSSTTLAALFFYLSRYPEAYRKASEEVRRAFGSAQDVSIGPKLNSCIYLRACLDEALRMAPAVASAPWREVIVEGAVFDGCPIPAGLDVGMGIYSIQHNETYVTDPFVFQPERWLVNSVPSSTRESVDRARSVFNPFSVGPRSCVGKGLATAELMFIMATVLATFDFKKSDGPDGSIGEGKPDAAFGLHRKEEFQMIDHVICAKEGPMLRFQRRSVESA